jgi:hypothetical protein
MVSIFFHMWTDNLAKLGALECAMECSLCCFSLSPVEARKKLDDCQANLRLKLGDDADLEEVVAAVIARLKAPTANAVRTIVEERMDYAKHILLTTPQKPPYTPVMHALLTTLKETPALGFAAAALPTEQAKLKEKLAELEQKVGIPMFQRWTTDTPAFFDTCLLLCKHQQSHWWGSVEEKVAAFWNVQASFLPGMGGYETNKNPKCVTRVPHAPVSRTYPPRCPAAQRPQPSGLWQMLRPSCMCGTARWLS